MESSPLLYAIKWEYFILEPSWECSCISSTAGFYSVGLNASYTKSCFFQKPKDFKVINLQCLLLCCSLCALFNFPSPSDL